MLAATNESEATVILVHGLWMNASVLLLQQRWLRCQDFSVNRFSYPSWRGGLSENAHLLSRFITKTPGRIIHIVAHSLGGLVTLTMLEDDPDPRIRRVVLIATPCAGSHCGSTLLASPVFAAVVGHSYKDWCHLPKMDIRPPAEIGVIAGTLSIGIGRLIPGLAKPNDGLITVDETHLTAAKDCIQLPVSHSGMLVSHACARQVASFLRTGKFSHD